MKRITKDEYLRLLKNRKVEGLKISTMKEGYVTPVIFEFIWIGNGNVHYFLTNENPDLQTPAIKKEMWFNYEYFIDDVKMASYTDIIILNRTGKPDWEV